jgi:hypothetical protein
MTRISLIIEPTIDKVVGKAVVIVDKQNSVQTSSESFNAFSTAPDLFSRTPDLPFRYAVGDYARAGTHHIPFRFF